MSSVPLKRIGGLATAATVLAIVAAVVSLLSALVARAAADEARDFLDGEISEDDFLEAYLPSSGFTVAQSAVMVALVVITIIWMHRIASNHRVLGRDGTWGPGWAIAGWFVPPCVFVIPFLMLRELWKASDPTVPVGSDAWKQRPVSPVVPLWWVLYGILPILLAVWQGTNPIEMGLGDTETLAETLDEGLTVMTISGIVTAAAAIAYLLLVRGLTARHTQLTGEATTPR